MLAAKPEEEGHVFSETINATPDTYYRVEVSAVNHENVTGEPEVRTLQAPAGGKIKVFIHFGTSRPKQTMQTKMLQNVASDLGLHCLPLIQQILDT